MSGDEDDKATVILDLAALKKMKFKQEEDLANIASELEFNTDVAKKSPPPSKPAPNRPQPKPQTPVSATESALNIILFDFQSSFFTENKGLFPKGHKYVIATTLPELNQHLKSKKFQIVVFNYDVNSKAVNQLSAQVKKKFPDTKAIIMARAISPEKAKMHARTPNGASGYYQYPLDAAKIQQEFLKVAGKKKMVA